jgi:hypothetical protein
MGWIIIGLLVFGLAAVASWRRRGRSRDDLIGDQRKRDDENLLRGRSGHPWGMQ